MKSKNCQKVVLKALGHILYGSNFIASDVKLFLKCHFSGNASINVSIAEIIWQTFEVIIDVAENLDYRKIE